MQADDGFPVVDAASGVIKGWLEKKGEKGLVKSWKRRFFLSAGTRLHYFEHEQDASAGSSSSALGFIEMSSVLAVGIDSKSTRKAVFTIVTPSRTYSLLASSEAAAAAWVEALERFVKDVKERLRAEFHQSVERLPPISSKQVLNDLSSVAAAAADRQTMSDPGLGTVVDPSESLEHQLKLAVADRDTQIESLRSKLAELEASHSRECQILKEKLSVKERLAAGLSMQKDLLKLIASDASPDEKAEKLFAAITERDDSILNLKHMSDLQMKRIRTLELQLSLGTSSSLTAAAAATPTANKTPHQKQAETVNRLVREESMSPAGALGSPSVARKTRHRRNSSVGSPSTPEPKASEIAVDTPKLLEASTPSSIAPASLPKSLQERRAMQARRAHSMMLPVKEGGVATGAASLGNAGNAAATNSPLTAEKKLVTPPPWQIKKMIDNVERRSSLPVSASPAEAASSTSVASPMLGLKSHGNVAALPGSHQKNTSLSLSSPSIVPLSAAVPAKDISVAVEGKPGSVGPFTDSERELAKSLHPLGLPTQGMIRLPHNSKAKSDDPVMEEAGAEPKKREGHLGGGNDAVVQTPIRRVVSRSADHWAEAAAAAKVRSTQGGKKHESSLPLEVVLPDDKLPIVGEKEADAEELASASSGESEPSVVATASAVPDQAAVHMTPSFDGLAEKIEELTTPKKVSTNSSGSTPFRGSMATGHASRFQEQLLEQLRAEQFELLKSLREQKDEAEIQELRMGQLMERIRNGEEIIDEKTRECEEQKVIIRELRKESAQLRAKLDAERTRSRSSSISSEVGLTSSMKRLQFTDESDKSKPVNSPRDSPKKQFQLSDDDQSEEEAAVREGPSIRKLSSEFMRSISKLEEELKKEVMYREALEKQLVATQQRHNVEDSNLRAKFAAEMEATIAQHQREKSHMAGEVLNLQRKIAEVEKQLSGRTKEIQRLRMAAGEQSSPGTTGPIKNDLIEMELQLMQRELQEREEELSVFRRRAHEAESARESALCSLDAIKHALSQTDREVKALRAQVAQQKVSGSNRSGGFGISPTTTVSAFSPPRENDNSSSALMAHQEHGALLQRELEAAQREFKAAVGLRDTLLNETESELAAERRQRSVLRQRVLAAAREGQSVERIVETDWEEEVKLCSAELFHSLAVAAKLQQMSISGSPCNVDVSSLMDLATERGVHWKNYRTWIQKQIQQQQLMSPQMRQQNTDPGSGPNSSSSVRLVFTQSPKPNRLSLDKFGHE